MPNGKWSCFSTFDGYDHAFVTNSKEESQQQMRDQLKKNDLEGHGLFLREITHAMYEHTTKPNWKPPVLDHL